MQEECEARLKVLEEAAASAQRMTSHGDADGTVGAFKVLNLVPSSFRPRTFCPLMFVCKVNVLRIQLSIFYGQQIQEL
jgi:hypothetical protein